MKITTKSTTENRSTASYVATKWWVKNDTMLMPGASTCSTSMVSKEKNKK
jgi:hypothetical protein